jgi:predicted MPP superfamily phosphohydrolase
MSEYAVRQRLLTELVQPRIAVEEQFARAGHTYRHGPAHYLFENHILRPTLKIGLSAIGLYKRGIRNALSPVVREVPLRFPSLPAAFDGFQLLQISDFHIDGVNGLAEALVPILRRLKPDACVFTGDYRFEDRGSCEEVYPRMRLVVDAISATHGIYGILGNHDAAEIAFALEDMGVHMLVNESACIDQGNDAIWIAGIDDPFDYRCDDLPAALTDIPSGAFKILLAHAPELYTAADAQGIHLYLSGHTHAGQIRLPFVGSIKHNARCPLEYTFGPWQHGRMKGYTSAGVGCSALPIRYNCPPELVLFRLLRDSN